MHTFKPQTELDYWICRSNASGLESRPASLVKRCRRCASLNITSGCNKRPTNDHGRNKWTGGGRMSVLSCHDGAWLTERGRYVSCSRYCQTFELMREVLLKTWSADKLYFLEFRLRKAITWRPLAEIPKQNTDMEYVTKFGELGGQEDATVCFSQYYIIAWLYVFENTFVKSNIHIFRAFHPNSVWDVLEDEIISASFPQSREFSHTRNKMLYRRRTIGEILGKVKCISRYSAFGFIPKAWSLMKHHFT